MNYSKVSSGLTHTKLANEAVRGSHAEAPENQQNPNNLLQGFWLDIKREYRSRGSSPSHLFSVLPASSRVALDLVVFSCLGPDRKHVLYLVFREDTS